MQIITEKVEITFGKLILEHHCLKSFKCLKTLLQIQQLLKQIVTTDGER